MPTAVPEPLAPAAPPAAVEPLAPVVPPFAVEPAAPRAPPALGAPPEPVPPALTTPYSKAPRSGAAPAKPRPTSVPLSIILLPAGSFMKSMFGRLPSACRAPMKPVSVTLAKSAAAGTRLRSQVLNAVSTPVMFVFLLGNPMLFLILWTSVPMRMIVTDESLGSLASMLYCVPLL